MKRIILFLGVLLFFNACVKDKPVTPKPSPPTPEKPDETKVEPDVGRSKKFQIDSIKTRYTQLDPFKDMQFIKDSVWKDSAGVSFVVQYNARNFRMQDQSPAFPGAFIGLNDFKENRWRPISAMANTPIGLLSTSALDPSDSTILPSLKNVNGLIDVWMKNRTDNTSMDFTSRSPTGFSMYPTAFLTFGGVSASSYYESVDPQWLLPMETSPYKTKKSGCMVSTSSVNYDAFFDIVSYYNENGPLLEAQAADLGYVRSVSYGFEVFVFLESDEPEETLRLAMNRTLAGSETQADITLLKQAKAKAYYRHPSAAKISKDNLNGYDRLIEYRQFFKNEPFNYRGVPLFYSLENRAGEAVVAQRFIRLHFPLK